MEESRKPTYNVTYECIGASDAIDHLALYVHQFLCSSNSAEDYKNSCIVLNRDISGTLTMVVWPEECTTDPPAWLMDYKLWKYFTSNIINNYYKAKEDI